MMYATGGKVNEQRAYLLRAFQGLDVGARPAPGRPPADPSAALARTAPASAPRAARILSGDELLGQLLDGDRLQVVFVLAVGEDDDVVGTPLR